MSISSATRTAFLLCLSLSPGESNYWGAQRRHKYSNKLGQSRREQSNNGMIARRAQQNNQNCAKTQVFLTCEQYFFAIWDQDGKLVYDSYLYGTDYSECYDPTACYLYEMVSESGDCEYKIVMDGQTVKSGPVIYNPEGSSLVVRAGQCTEKCPGQNELMILSYIEYDGATNGDIDYILHLGGGGDEEGIILEGDSKSFCVEPGACSVIARKTLEWSFYFVLGPGEEVLDFGGFEKTQTFGECDTTCEDVMLLMSTNDLTGGLNLTLTTDGIEMYKKSLTPGMEDSICIDTSKCNLLDTVGNAYYYFFKDGAVYDRGFASEYRLFGPCKTVCMSRPTLAITKRGQDIVTRLFTSGMNELANFNSARYQAACWLVYDDLRQLEANDPQLIQRYILALIYFTTGGPSTWEAQLGFMGGKDECFWEAIKCNEENFVTYIYLASNNLQGTLASEVFSLIHLDFLDIARNVFTGTIPNGLSRLPMKYLDICENSFTGTIPEDFLMVNGFEYISIGRNLLSGTIPSAHGDLTNVTEIWLHNNFFSGTIPEWFNEITGLQTLFLHFNKFTGTIPEYYFPNLRKYLLWDNQLTGTLPPSVFKMPSLKEFQVTSNFLTGPIVVPEHYERSMVKLWLDSNSFTGTIPSEIGRMSKMKTIYLANNNFNGTFPQEWKNLKKLYGLTVENNKVTGTIPFVKCKNIQVLSADCSEPINIECPCCTRCSGMFTTYKDVLSCPSSVLNVRYDSLPNDKITYSVENAVPQLIAAAFEYTRFASNDFYACISPTDCLVLNSQSDAKFDVRVDNKLLFKGLEGSGTQVRFGYASDGSMEAKTCDDYIICNRAIRANTAQRRLINLITRVTGLNMFAGQSSNQYNSLCWWLNDLDRLTEAELQSTVLVQRYFLAVLYNSNGGLNWYNNQNWMSDLPECEWYGVKCETHEGVISKIDLSNNNLVGSIPKEIGEIRGLEHLILSGNNLMGNIPLEIVQLDLLQTLDLSNNRIGGNIPVEIKFLYSLLDFDLNTNRITGTIPSEISLIRHLTSINFGKNALSGEVPAEIRELKGLKYIAVDENLMAGELSMIDTLSNLEYLDFSNNYFEGPLPLFGAKQKSLQIANLNNNQFSGAIPSGVEELTELRELMVYGNQLTGSLPSQLGLMHNMSKISFAYNLLKGTIPSELANVKKLELLHLHGNMLVGESDHFDYSITSYITDCGITETSDGLTQCLDCTECCNVDNACITTAETWPRNYVKKIGVQADVLIIIISFAFSTLLIGLCMVFSVFSKKLPRLPYIVRQEFQQDSAYRWYLSASKMAWFLATFSAAFQIWIIITFLRAGDFTAKGNEWLYSIDCPHDSTVCDQRRTTNSVGWATFIGILAVFLLQDFIPGALIFYESSVDLSFRGIMAGIILMNITILSTVASSTYLYATAISNIAIIKDAVIVLFLNSIDEQVFLIVQRVSPGWTDNVEDDIMNYTLNKLTKEISEVMDDDEFDDVYAPDKDMDKDVNKKGVFGTTDDDGHEDENYDNVYDDKKYGRQNSINCFDDNGDHTNGHAIANTVDFEAMKEQMISEVLGIHEADKTKILEEHKVDMERILEEHKADMERILEEHETDKTKILEEHKADMRRILEEHKADMRRILEAHKVVKEENALLMGKINAGKEE